MMKVYSLLFSFIFCVVLYAQRDTLRNTNSASAATILTTGDTIGVRKDSISPVKTIIPLHWEQDTAFNRFFINRNVPKNKQSVYAINAVRQPENADEQFYILAGLLLFTGLVRALFPKYFSNLFQQFLQSSQRHKQSKESLTQDTLPSFLMNIVFVLSGGLLLATFFKIGFSFKTTSFVLLWLYACTALAVIYLVKSLFISLFGWSFDANEPANNYKFIVFLVNKIAGLCFIPLILILTYATGSDFTVVTTIAVMIIALFLLYRYIVSLNIIGKKLKINPLHFFLYLCAVEILPLLITYKVLLITKEL